MDHTRKAAYRRLLYTAMLSIRPIQWLHGSALNPLAWFRYRRRGRIAGEVADWLHNMALFSSLDFERFDEERFWSEHQRLCSRLPNEGLERYRVIFDDYLVGRVHVV